MKKYICDACGKESTEADDIPTYSMFVCKNYDGDEIELCVDCENKIKNMWRKNDLLHHNKL